MAYESVQNSTTLMFFGNVFLPELVTQREVVVDGDLITKKIECPKLILTHGSLICPEIRCPDVAAEILGVFDFEKPFSPPPGWRFLYLRPVHELPKAENWLSEQSIDNVVALFRDPAIVRDRDLVESLMTRTLARPNCARARVLFRVAIEELLDEPGALTEFGHQILTLLKNEENLPAHWRY